MRFTGDDMATIVGEVQKTSTEMVVESEPVQISEQDDRKYKHITLPNKMQVLLISDPDTDKEAAAMDVRVGHTSDPLHVQGIAHFCEHMLFLGTGKYPREDTYNALLNSHGGRSNAFTSIEDTNYFFDVNSGHLDEALDVFSRFFIDPLFTESATGRELKAIYSEHSQNLQSDGRRIYQVMKAAASEKHPWHQFSTGNVKTLDEDPAEKGVDIREELLRFHRRYYTANLMRLVVLGKGGLDELQEMVVGKFSPVVNTNAPVPSFGGTVPFGPEQVKRRVSVVPVKDTREIYIFWPMPPIDDHFRSKPASYISHLLGHQGPGSLLSLLKSKGWANSLGAFPCFAATDWSMFGVAIQRVTEEGLKHVDEIVRTTYQCLSMIRDCGVQEWVHEEVQAMAAINFRFSSKVDPMRYVSGLAGYMQKYPPELTVAGPNLRYDYEPDLVRDLLERLVPSNMLLVVSSWGFKGKTDKVEQWIGSEYSSEALGDDLIESWENCGRREDLRLPKPNPYIPTDFTLRPAAAAAVAVSTSPIQQPGTASPLPPPAGATSGAAPSSPSLIRDDPSCRLWHKTDGRFRRPKVNVEIALSSPVLYESPESLVLATLLADLLKEDLNEETYMAQEAGLSFNTNVSKGSLALSFKGYSDTMEILLERVVQQLASLADTLVQGKRKGQGDEGIDGGEGGLAMFGRVRQLLLEQYKNAEFITPYQHAMAAMSSCLQAPHWSNDEKLAAMKGPGITFQGMLLFIPRLLSALHMEMLVHGNATAAEALGLASVVVDGLKARPLPPNFLLEERVVDLGGGQGFLAQPESKQGGGQKEGEEEEKGAAGTVAAPEVVLVPEYRRWMACPNKEETNSAVMVTFQVCLDGARDRAPLALFAHLLKDKCFNQLRTQAQLGYLVWSGEWVHGGHVHSAYFLVQSDDHSPCCLDESIEHFLAGFKETLTSLTPEEFVVNVNAVVQSLLEKDKNLDEETRRHWREISGRSYVFDRSVRDAKAVKRLSQAELLEFYQRNISVGGAGRRKLSAWAYGNQYPTKTTVATAAITEGRQEEGEGSAGNNDEDPTAGAAPAAAGRAGVCGDDWRRVRKVVAVEDYAEFKRSMPLLPLRKPAPVQLVDPNQPNP